MAARCEAGGDSWSWNSEYQRLLSLLRTAKGHSTRTGLYTQIRDLLQV